MRNHHRCDPRSDYRCARCEQDQLDYERMVENAREDEANADLHEPCEACDETGNCCHGCVDAEHACQHEWRPSADGSVCAKCQESDRKEHP